MAKKKKRPSVFSVTKTVKANARERLGTPPPSTPILDRRTKNQRGRAKHKKSVEEVIAGAERDSYSNAHRLR